jgi:hypothetical protein
VKEAPQSTSRGTVVVDSKGKREELEVVDFLKASYRDNRLITVAGVEDGSFVLLVENPPSSGRSNDNKMWLSEESLLGVAQTILLYLGAKGEDLHALALKSVGNADIRYSYSDNLHPLKPDTTSL